MLEYDRIDISEGININKINATKECDIKQILQGHSLNIKIYPLEVSNIQGGAAELNISSTRVDKFYIQQE